MGPTEKALWRRILKERPCMAEGPMVLDFSVRNTDTGMVQELSSNALRRLVERNMYLAEGEPDITCASACFSDKREQIGSCALRL